MVETVAQVGDPFLVRVQLLELLLRAMVQGHQDLLSIILLRVTDLLRQPDALLPRLPALVFHRDRLMLTAAADLVAVPQAAVDPTVVVAVRTVEVVVPALAAVQFPHLQRHRHLQHQARVLPLVVQHHQAVLVEREATNLRNNILT